MPIFFALKISFVLLFVKFIWLLLNFINGKQIGVNNEPYIIAELSANHGGDILRAKESIKAAKESGASAIKLQTYTPDTMTINHKGGLFDIKDKSHKKSNHGISYTLTGNLYLAPILWCFL